ncbi:hypothetical protein MYU51_019717 [Penicillium brevicompactum]
MPTSQQPTDLIYCTTSVCVFPRYSANIRVAEPRTFDHNARGQGPQLFAVSLPLVLAIRAFDSSRAFGSRKLPGASSAAYSKRQPERTGYNIMLNGMNGDCIDEDNSLLIFPSQIECEATNLVCSSSSIPMRSQAICPFLMATGGMDEE